MSCGGSGRPAENFVRHRPCASTSQMLAEWVLSGRPGICGAAKYDFQTGSSCDLGPIA
jgi:hypothetical protein